MPSIYDPDAFETYCRETRPAGRRVDAHHLKRLRVGYFKKQLPSQAALEALPPDQASAIGADCQFETLALKQTFNSELDGASKLLFSTPDGFTIEAVLLRIGTGRTSLCVSSQVGCAAKCSFCATGKMGIARSLDSSLILDQLAQANQILAPEGRQVRNVVFMGMGEPFHNEDNLYRTVELMCDTAHFNLSERHVVVSTVGLPDAMVRFAQRFPKVHLALSLHSADQAVRESIIPLAKQNSLTDLKAAIQAVNTIQGQSIMIEYLMLKGLNDSDDALEKLDIFCQGLDVHINLIPFNTVDGSGLQSTDKPRRESFANALKARGYQTTLRYSLGADIEAACGQLVRQENRANAQALNLHPTTP